MDWKLIKIIGIIVAGLALPLYFFPEEGFLKGTPSISTFALLFLGLIIIIVANGKARESDIIEFYIHKGYSIEEAKERTNPTITILKERKCWPNCGLDDIISASQQVDLYFKKKR